MLMLTRKEEQAVQIGDDITMTVYQDKQGRGRLGIDAPKDVKILRDELTRKEPQRPAMVAGFDYCY